MSIFISIFAPMKKILLYVWQLPQNLVGLVMMPFLGKKDLVAEGHYNKCWCAENMSGGISLGKYCYISKYMRMSSNCDEKIAHEFNGHTVDSKKWGPLYLLVVGIPSILNAIFGFTSNYFDWYTEVWANNNAGLIKDTKYSTRLQFKDDESRQNLKKYLV